VLEDAPHHVRIIDPRDHPHRPFALRALQYTLRMSRALARMANSLTYSTLAADLVAGSCAFSAFARSPRARFEYQLT